MSDENHPPKCECCECNGGSMEDFRRKEEEILAKYGWCAHYVFDDDTMPMGSNYHTHGFAENLGHPDFQCVLRIDPQLLHGILTSIAEQVKKGRKFEAGMRYDRVLKDMDVTFINAREGGRKVLRLIIPDKNGELDADKMEAAFALQYDLKKKKAKKLKKGESWTGT
jgi:hypothetical protein